MEIEGKAAVVSGGASGIGRATVLALTERGAKVIVADLDEAGGRRTVELAEEPGGRNSRIAPKHSTLTSSPSPASTTEA